MQRNFIVVRGPEISHNGWGPSTMQKYLIDDVLGLCAYTLQ